MHNANVEHPSALGANGPSCCRHRLVEEEPPVRRHGMQASPSQKAAQSLPQHMNARPQAISTETRRRSTSLPAPPAPAAHPQTLAPTRHKAACQSTGVPGKFGGPWAAALVQGGPLRSWGAAWRCATKEFAPRRSATVAAPVTIYALAASPAAPRRHCQLSYQSSGSPPRVRGRIGVSGAEQDMAE